MQAAVKLEDVRQLTELGEFVRQSAADRRVKNRSQLAAHYILPRVRACARAIRFRECQADNEGGDVLSASVAIMSRNEGDVKTFNIGAHKRCTRR